MTEIPTQEITENAQKTNPLSEREAIRGNEPAGNVECKCGERHFFGPGHRPGLDDLPTSNPRFIVATLIFPDKP